MVIDEDSRTIVLEGTGGADGGLTNLLRMVGRARPNGRAYRALEDPRVRFSKRLYTSFNTDLKKVVNISAEENTYLNDEVFITRSIGLGELLPHRLWQIYRVGLRRPWQVTGWDVWYINSLPPYHDSH